MDSLMNHFPAEIVFKIEKDLHKLYMSDLIEEINEEYFRRYEYEEYSCEPIEVDIHPEHDGYIIWYPPSNNYDLMPSVDDRHGREKPKKKKRIVRKKIDVAMNHLPQDSSSVEVCR